MRLACLWLWAAAGALAQSFAGASGGLSTLSADAAKSGSPPSEFSQYKPENGATASVFAGYDFSDWWSVQASYGWNRNSVVLSGGGPVSAYEVPATVTMHTGAVEAMLYFRRRSDRIRPYLSAGPGVTGLRASPAGDPLVRPRSVAPPASFHSTGIALRVAVGIDVRVSGRFALRYSFGETIQPNAIGNQLLPPSSRNLANFQNQWGLVWRFR
jgi:hypothetical protein